MALPSPIPNCACGKPAAITVASVPTCEVCFPHAELQARLAHTLCTCCDARAVLIDDDNEPLCAEHAESMRQRHAADDYCPGCEGGHGWLCDKCTRAARR